VTDSWTEMNSLIGYGPRPTSDEYFMTMALLVSSRSTCVRRQVGCVLIDKHNKILATGYNGVAQKQTHCIDKPCPGAESESGKDIDQCYAIHAEQNALLQCKDSTKVYACFSTTVPCVMCTKLFLNTTLKRMIYLESYPSLNISKNLWNQARITGKLDWYQMSRERVDYVVNRTFLASRK